VRRSPSLFAALMLLLAADAGAGTLVIDPPSLSFGNVSVTAGPVTSTLTITNFGSTTTISGFSMAFGCATFTVSAPGLPASLPNSASITVTVTYDPYDRGTDLCTVTVNDFNGVTDAFELSGAGIAAELQISPPSLTFADQPWSSGTGQTLNVTLTNVGELPIASTNLGRQLTTGTHFALGATLGLPIGPGEFATVPVTFDPASAGPKSDLLTLSLDNDSPVHSNPTVSLSGTGIGEATGVGDPGRFDGIMASPSPTRGTLAVRYAIPRAGSVALEVCDLAGRVVARVRAYEPAAGTRSLVLRDRIDWSPAAGVYFVRATLDGNALGTRRVLVLR
jgi:hypothetical protein